METPDNIGLERRLNLDTAAGGRVSGAIAEFSIVETVLVEVSAQSLKIASVVVVDGDADTV